MSNRRRTTQIRLQCRRRGTSEGWHTIRTLSAASAHERRDVHARLYGQQIAWHYSGQFDNHEWRIA